MHTKGKKNFWTNLVIIQQKTFKCQFARNAQLAFRAQKLGGLGSLEAWQQQKGIFIVVAKLPNL